MKNLISSSSINFKTINEIELPIMKRSIVGRICEDSVLQRAKNAFYKYNMKNYTKALYIEYNGSDEYAIIGCYKFKRKFQKFKGNKTGSSWNEYKIFKIKYDNKYDNLNLYGSGGIDRDDYVSRQNRTWYEND